MTFNHIDVCLPSLERETIDSVRYYSIPDNGELIKMVSITSITAILIKKSLLNGEKELVSKQQIKSQSKATSRGTDMHTLVENYLYNKSLPEVQPLSNVLFKIAKKELNKIDNIHCLEGALYSKHLGVAGTTDCIGEHEGELSVVDFKTSKKPKPRDWIENYFVQAMFYGMAYYEMTGTPIKKLVIIMACESGECVLYEERDLKKYMKLVVQYIKKFVNDRLGVMSK